MAHAIRLFRVYPATVSRLPQQALTSPLYRTFGSVTPQPPTARRLTSKNASMG